MPPKDTPASLIRRAYIRRMVVAEVTVYAASALLQHVEPWDAPGTAAADGSELPIAITECVHGVRLSGTQDADPVNVEHAKNAMHKADGILVVLPHSLAAGAAVEKTLGLVREAQCAATPQPITGILMFCPPQYWTNVKHVAIVRCAESQLLRKPAGAPRLDQYSRMVDIPAPQTTTWPTPSRGGLKATAPRRWTSPPAAAGPTPTRFAAWPR
jgi:hypothetical protein